METKIKNIEKVFDTTFKLVLKINPLLEGDEYIHISKEDRMILKQTYKAYNMKRYIRWYGSFEGLILKYSLDTGQIPVVAAIQLCQKLNRENGN